MLAGPAQASDRSLKAFLQLAVALLCSLSAGAMASQRILNVGYYEFAPAIYTDAHGTARGELAELTRRVARQAGYGVHFRALPGARLYAALENGSIDLWPGAQGKPELAAHTLEWSAYPQPDQPQPLSPRRHTGAAHS